MGASRNRHPSGSSLPPSTCFLIEHRRIPTIGPLLSMYVILDKSVNCLDKALADLIRQHKLIRNLQSSDPHKDCQARIDDHPQVYPKLGPTTGLRIPQLRSISLEIQYMVVSNAITLALSLVPRDQVKPSVYAPSIFMPGSDYSTSVILPHRMICHPLHGFAFPASRPRG